VKRGSRSFRVSINNEGKETMNTRIMKRTRGAVLAMLAALAAAGVSGPAAAAGFGGALQPGSTVCTDWLRTDGGGVYLYAYATGGGTYAWTVRMSAAPGGAESEIFRTVTSGFFTRNVVPPVSGRFYYRSCLEVSNRPATGYRLEVSAGAGAVNPMYGVGPHVAVLTPGSMACGEFAMGPTRLRGSSDRTVQWSLRGTDLDYASLGRLFAVNGASVDRAFDPGPDVSSTDACATATAVGTSTVSFELLDR
jgi:hypothetical protein